MRFTSLPLLLALACVVNGETQPYPSTLVPTDQAEDTTNATAHAPTASSAANPSATKLAATKPAAAKPVVAAKLTAKTATVKPAAGKPVIKPAHAKTSAAKIAAPKSAAAKPIAKPAATKATDDKLDPKPPAKLAPKSTATSEQAAFNETATLLATDCVANHFPQSKDFEQLWDVCSLAVPRTAVTSLLTPDEPGHTSDKTANWLGQTAEQFGSLGVKNMLSKWLKTALPDASSAADLSDFIKRDKKSFKENPTGVLGGKLLAVPGYNKAVTAVISLLADSIPAAALVTVVAPHVTALCDDQDVGAAYYQTAKRFPSLTLLQEDLVATLRAKPAYRDWPAFESLATRFLALGNTTDVMPYAPVAAPVSFLQLIMHSMGL